MKIKFILIIGGYHEDDENFCSCGFKRMSGYELGASEKGNNKVTSTGEGVIEDHKEDIKKLSYEEKREMKPDF